MNANTGSNPQTGPDAQDIAAQLSAIRTDLAELRHVVLDIRAALTGHHSTSAPSVTLARRNPERLAAEVLRRSALLRSENPGSGDTATDPGHDTELDVLIDRLHDLALASRDGAAPG